MYPIFHEAVSLPVVKDWLRWDENETAFKEQENRSVFYRLLTPMESEEDGPRDPKLRTYMQVRQLRSILPNAESRRLLLDFDRPFEDALAAAKKEEFSRLWASEVSDAISALESIEVTELKKISEENLELLRRLKALVEERLSDYESLKKSKQS